MLVGGTELGWDRARTNLRLCPSPDTRDFPTFSGSLGAPALTPNSGTVLLSVCLRHPDVMEGLVQDKAPQPPPQETLLPSLGGPRPLGLVSSLGGCSLWGPHSQGWP